MDEDDVYGMTDDYVVEAESRDCYHFDLASDEEDDGIQRRCAPGPVVSLGVSAAVVVM
jgi:hypothetical protein